MPRIVYDDVGLTSPGFGMASTVIFWFFGEFDAIHMLTWCGLFPNGN
jgi:hypothetical protein